MEPQRNACDEYVTWSQGATRRAALLAGLGLASWAKTTLAQATFRSDEKEGPVLVVVFLRGGADGLNMVAPYAEDAYYRARPTLALKAPGDRTAGAGERLLDLDGFFGLHPALGSLHPLFKEGQAACIHAVGSGDETRSHFEAMGTMEHGVRNNLDRASGGWLARHVAATPERAAPMRVVAVAPTMPDSLSGATGAVAFQKLEDYRIVGDPGSLPMFQRVLEDLHHGQGPVEEAGARTLRALRKLNSVTARGSRSENGADYGATPFGAALRDVAHLIRSQVGLEIACLEIGGWDTHIAQGAGTGWHANLMRELADGIAAFFKDLGDDGSRVNVVVQSEFGRRIEENSGFGTDHGRGGVMLAVGSRVQGGKVFGRWPTLSPGQTVGPGDLDVTTDYRTVLAEALEVGLECPRVDNVFPNLDHRRLGVFA